MGCASSKPEEDDDDNNDVVVSICKERIRLMKSTVKRRYELADAHCRYYQSLYAVSAAIRLFVARHSSQSSSPFLISSCPCPPPEPEPQSPTSNPIPMFFQQTPTSPVSKFSFLERENEEEEEESDWFCEEFYGMQLQQQQRDFGWDFLNNPFDGGTEMVNGFCEEDNELREIREREGIPELEEEEEEEENGDGEGEGERNENNDDDELKQWEKDSFRMIDTNKNGRELLEALKDVEDHFIKASESGMEVSKLLEANTLHIQSGMEEIKESSNKLIHSITWNRTTSSRSSTSSRKSFLASSSKSSSTWTIDFKNDPFDDYETMKSGSHSLTLSRLYAWEKKLFEEVKTGEETRKIYERKCTQLRNQDAMGDGVSSSLDKTRAEVKELYTRILVALRSAETISERIQILRDKELQPQIIELLCGLMRTWTIISESHEAQNKAILEVKSFDCPTYGKFCNDSHRLATLQLDAELQNWCACFTGYVSAQRAYIEALNGWLSKFIAPQVEFSSNGDRSSSVPIFLVTCHDWFDSVEKLPYKTVKHAMKNFRKNIQDLWVQQGEEQQQKRKVDGLTKELERRVQTFQKEQNRALESNQKSEAEEVRRRVEYLTEKKNVLEMFRNKVDAEKAKHHSSMQDTQRITWNGFQTGFSSVFESIGEFSKASVKIYSDLVTNIENAAADSNKSSSSCMEGMGSHGSEMLN